MLFLLATLTILALYSLITGLWAQRAEAATTATPFTLKGTSVCVSGKPTVRLTWNTPQKIGTRITVFRNPNAKGVRTWGLYTTSTLLPLMYTDKTVKSGTTYQYIVTARSLTGSTRTSSIVRVRAGTCTTAPTSNTTTRTTTTKKSSSGGGGGSSSSGNSAHVAVVSPPASTPPSKTPDTSAPKPATPPSASPALTFNPRLSAVCAANKPQVTLTWSNPNNATQFTIWRNPSALGAAAWGTVGTSNVTTYTDTSVLTGNTYQYQISARALDGSVRYSDILTTPPMPTCTTSTPTTPTPPTTNTLSWGVYTGWGDAAIQEFESRTGENPSMIAQFIHWGNGGDFPTHMTKHAKDKNRTLIIFWEPSNYQIASTNQPAFSYDAITRGDWDTYIRSFAAAARAYGGPIILIPFSEMNGNWSPWSGTLNGNTPAKAAEGYRHVRTVFGTVPNVKFGWAPNSNSVPNTAQNAIELYYPGDAYVDYVGVDGFNFNDPANTPAWLSFDAIFGKPLTLLSKYNKPMYLFSFASAEGPQKAAWITDAVNVQMPKYPLLVGWNWFNQNKEKNWLVWSDEASLSAFKAVTP
jgi:beta-mannanase